MHLSDREVRRAELWLIPPFSSQYEGTYDIHGLILGKAITGIQAFQ